MSRWPMKDGGTYPVVFELGDETIADRQMEGWKVRWKGKEIQWFYLAPFSVYFRAMLLAEMSSLGFSFVTETEGAWYFSKPTE